MDSKTQGIVADFADIRVDPTIAEELFRTVAAGMDADDVLARLDVDVEFQIVAIRMTQDILAITTMAQSVDSAAPFSRLVESRSFCGENEDLQEIGRAIVETISQRPRLPNPEVADQLLAARYQQILATI
jgi:hypothetical protein